ncbi:hypothetical protein N7524_011758 [Penicillium chrysogenum]|nr:hypothetical protein N7524_011758 [Penicillium chrysogenum]
MTNVMLSPTLETTRLEPIWPEGLSQQYLERHGLEACLVHMMGCHPILLHDGANNSRIRWLDIIRNGVSNRQSDGSCHYSIEGRSYELDQHMVKKLDDARPFVADVNRFLEYSITLLSSTLALVGQERERAETCISSLPPQCRAAGKLTKTGKQGPFVPPLQLIQRLNQVFRTVDMGI